MRQRGKLLTRSTALREDLATLEDEMHELDERIASLGSLVGETEQRRAGREFHARPHDPRALTGSAIRITAVRLLADSGHVGAIHYRQWFSLLREAGYEVNGKRPDAVFLSQITRSPVVKGTTKSGVYQLDFDAPGRLSHELEVLQQKLSNAAAGASSSDEDLAQRTARQEKIGLEIRRTQRALREALGSLGHDKAEAATRLAA